MEELKSNVIHFPIEKRLREVDDERDYFVDSLETFVEDITSDVLAELYNNGYEIDSDDYVCDVSMLFESLRSLVFRLNEIDHPIQEISQTIYRKYLIENSMEEDQLSLDFGDENELQ
jgi:hypothetical protein